LDATSNYRKTRGVRGTGENKLKHIILFITLLITSLSSIATNKIYVTQAGASLVFDVLQDGASNLVGNSSTASTVSGSASNFNIDQVGNSNVLTFDIDGDSFTGTFSTTGNSNDIDFNCDSGSSTSGCDSVTASVTFVGNSSDIDIDIGNTSSKSGDSSTVTILGASGTDGTVINASIDGVSTLVTITVDGDTNNYLLNIDDNGDVNGHTWISNQTGITADVDLVQSGSYDNYVSYTSVGDSQNVDITQTAGGTVTMTSSGSASATVKTININQTAHATATLELDGAGGTYDIDQTSASTIELDQTGASADFVINQSGGVNVVDMTTNGASANVDIIQRD
jgi:hypothetical protein